MGEREITARSDVYALGCVTYEMLIGDPPFIGSTAQAIVAKVMTEKPVSLQRQRERVPDAVEDAVLTALEKLPADRFASAAEFAEALGGTTGGSRDQWTGPHPVAALAGTPGWRERLRDPLVLLLGALAIAGVDLRRWTQRMTPERAGAGGALHAPGGAERPHQLVRLQLARGLARRPLAGLPRPGRRPAPAAHASGPGRHHGAAAAGHRGRRSARSSPPTADGSPSFVATSCTRSPSTARRRSCSGRRRAPSTASAGRRPGVVVVSGNTALFADTGGRRTGPPARRLDASGRRAVPRRPAGGGRRPQRDLLELVGQLARERQDRDLPAGPRRNDRARHQGSPPARCGGRHPGVRHGRRRHDGSAHRHREAETARSAGPADRQRLAQLRHRTGAGVAVAHRHPVLSERHPVVAGGRGRRERPHPRPPRRPPRLLLPPTLPGRPAARPHHRVGRPSGRLARRAGLRHSDPADHRGPEQRASGVEPRRPPGTVPVRPGRPHGHLVAARRPERRGEPSC